MLSSLPRVTRRSICGRSSFAFGRVVMIRSLSMSEASWLRNSAARWPLVLPSFRYAIPCRIAIALRGRDPSPSTRLRMTASPSLAHLAAAAGRDARHAERQAEAGENVLDLVE